MAPPADSAVPGRRRSRPARPAVPGERLVHLERPMSSMPSPPCAAPSPSPGWAGQHQHRVAPVTAPAVYRTSGVMPSSRAFSAVITSRAAAPSEIWEELPAWMISVLAERRFEPASFSTVVPRRMPLVGVDDPAAVGRHRDDLVMNAPPILRGSPPCDRPSTRRPPSGRNPISRDHLGAGAWLNWKPSPPGKSAFGPYGIPVAQAAPNMGLITSTPPATTTSC